MSCGPRSADCYRRAAGHVDKIIKRAQPGELPVEQPTRCELVVKQQTAPVLGLSIARSLPLRVDKLIE